MCPLSSMPLKSTVAMLISEMAGKILPSPGFILLLLPESWLLKSITHFFNQWLQPVFLLSVEQQTYASKTLFWTQNQRAQTLSLWFSVYWAKLIRLKESDVFITQDFLPCTSKFKHTHLWTKPLDHKGLHFAARVVVQMGCKQNKTLMVQTPTWPWNPL